MACVKLFVYNLVYEKFCNTWQTEMDAGLSEL